MTKTHESSVCELASYLFLVPEASCPTCSHTMENRVNEARKNGQLPELASFEVDVTTDPAQVLVKTNKKLAYQDVKSRLNSVLESTGFTLENPQPRETGDKTALHEPYTKDAVSRASVTPVDNKKSMRRHFAKGAMGLLSGALLLGLCISGLSLPLLALYALAFFGTLLALYLGKDIYLGAAKELKAKEPAMNTLFSISTLIALGVSLASFFVPWLPFMLDTALLIFGFVHLGESYKAATKNEVAKAANYRSLAPSRVMTQTPDGDYKENLVKNLQPGMLIRVFAGQVIPVNSYYVDENEDEEKPARTSAIINPYSGSPVPETIQPKQLLLAGVQVPANVKFITLRVAATEENSYLAKLEAESNNNAKEKAPIEKTAGKILAYFVPTILALAALSALAIGLLFSPLTAIQVVTTILASACPCTLGLIIPLTIKVAFIKASTQGVLFRNGEALQAAQEIDTVVFDLSGSLTEGEPLVSSGTANVPATNLSEEMLSCLAAIEKLSSHYFAKAIGEYLDKALRPSLALPPVATLEAQRPSGLIASIKGKTYVIGNQTMMREHGFSEEALKKAEIPAHEAEHVIYLAEDKEVKGCILLTDRLREEAPSVINKLQRMGKEVHICTGVSRETAERYVKKLEERGIQPLKGLITDCLPTRQEGRLAAKKTYIETLKAQGRKVAMIGDGINDTPGIEDSHFSIAIESAIGHKFAQQSAGAVINKVDNKLSLWPIISAFTLANQAIKQIKQNLAISLSYNLLTAFAIGGLLIGFNFVLNPAVGAALMFIQSALVFSNLLRWKKQKLPFANDGILGLQEGSGWESTTKKVGRQFPIPTRQLALSASDSLNNAGGYLSSSPKKENSKENSGPVTMPRLKA